MIIRPMLNLLIRAALPVRRLPKMIYLLLCVSVVVSCTTAPNLYVAPAERKTHVLLVSTNQQIERYQIAEASFVETLEGSRVSRVDLGGDDHPVDTLQDLLNKGHYDAVYCVGAKALGSIDYIDPDMPVVFSSVLNWRRFDTQENYYGIASEIAPEAQLTWFKYFFPEIKNIGVLFGSDNRTLIRDAGISADSLSLQLNAREVNSDTQLVNIATDLLLQSDTPARVEALWLISDPLVLASTENTHQLFEVAASKGVPIFTYSPFFIDLGAVLSISADLATTGRQAALTMGIILDGTYTGSSVQFPAGSNIILNAKKAAVYNMMLNEDALDSVNSIVGE